jgi:hypothetical protein
LVVFGHQLGLNSDLNHHCDGIISRYYLSIGINIESVFDR